MQSFGEELGIGERIAGRYQVLSVVGKGSMGVVYKTRDERLDRVVAIKTLRAQRISFEDDRHARRFEREARAASRMEHPNLITVHDFGTTVEGIPYLVMDYICGVPLYNILKEEKRLDPERAVRLFAQVCDGLYHAHHQGVIHRDLKPANIVIVQREDGRETVKIVDLGVAKIVHGSEHEEEADAITRTGEVCGSPIYLSPEQCMHEELDCRTDIYSLGVCLYESLTGVPPLRGPTVYDTIYMHVHEAPKPISVVAPDLELPGHLEEVVLRCLSKRREARFETMLQLKQDLLASLHRPSEGQSIHVMPPEQFFLERQSRQGAAPQGAEPRRISLGDEAGLPKPQRKTSAEVSIENPSAYGVRRKSAGDASPLAKPDSISNANESALKGHRAHKSLKDSLWDTITRPITRPQRTDIIGYVIVFVFGAGGVHLWHDLSEKKSQSPQPPETIDRNSRLAPSMVQQPVTPKEAGGSRTRSAASPAGKDVEHSAGPAGKSQYSHATHTPPATATARMAPTPHPSPRLAGASKTAARQDGDGSLQMFFSPIKQAPRFIATASPPGRPSSVSSTKASRQPTQKSMAGLQTLSAPAVPPSPAPKPFGSASPASPDRPAPSGPPPGAAVVAPSTPALERGTQSWDMTQKAHALLKASQYAQAESLLRQAVTLDPDNKTASELLAYTLSEQARTLNEARKFGEAVRKQQEAYKLSPTSARDQQLKRYQWNQENIPQ